MDGSAAGVDVEELAGAGFGADAGLFEFAGRAAATGLRCIVPDGEGGDCTISADTFTGELFTSAASGGGSVGSLAANGAVVGSFWPATDRSDEDLSRVISDFIDRQLHRSCRGLQSNDYRQLA